MSCSGADGTCERPAYKAGLCVGHWKRKCRGRPLSTQLRERSGSSFEALLRAALAYRDELETSTDEEHSLVVERFREALRRYLSGYVPSLLRGHLRGLLSRRRFVFSASARAEVEKFLAVYRKVSRPRRVPRSTTTKGATP